jgi:hypothetical protein
MQPGRAGEGNRSEVEIVRACSSSSSSSRELADFDGAGRSVLFLPPAWPGFLTKRCRTAVRLWVESSRRQGAMDILLLTQGEHAGSCRGRRRYPHRLVGLVDEANDVVDPLTPSPVGGRLSDPAPCPEASLGGVSLPSLGTLPPIALLSKFMLRTPVALNSPISRGMDPTSRIPDKSNLSMPVPLTTSRHDTEGRSN